MKNGITLIALIITIIVMLILVGVTINVAINGGLFETTKTARADTEKNRILEELIGMATWTSEGKINVDDLKSAAQAKWPDTEEPVNGKLTIPGKYGTYDYKVIETEISIWSDEVDYTGFYYGQIDRVNFGIFVKDNNQAFEYLLINDDPIVALEAGGKELSERRNYTFILENGEQKEYKNLAFINNNMKDGLLFTENGNELISLKFEYSEEPSNIDEHGNIKLYKSISENGTFAKTNFPFNTELTGDVYINNDLTVAIDETNNKLITIKDNNKILNYNLVIKTDFEANLSNGTTKDFSGKKVIFTRLADFNNLRVPSIEILYPIGYIENDKFIRLEMNFDYWKWEGSTASFDETTIDEAGIPKVFTKLEEKEEFIKQ